MTKIQNLSMILKKEHPKLEKINGLFLNPNVSVIDYWNLRFICNLVLAVWYFVFIHLTPIQ
jgi:hypothetical protein